MADQAEPGSRRPAPGELAEVQAFVNTADLESASADADELATAGSATAWLRGRGTGLEHPLTEEERRRLVEVREGLRSLLAAHHGHPAGVAVAARLDHLMAGVRLRPRVSDAGVTLVAAGGGLDGYLGRLAAAIGEARVGGTWERLKVCRSDSCRWAFYDHSKNARSSWCSMRVCGARAKARAYRARRSTG